MTNQEFIKGIANGTIKESKTVNSLVFDGKHLYSYGKHYPLLINIKGKWIINDRGYSSTTGQHIGCASQEADFKVNLQPEHTQVNGDLFQRVKESAQKEINELNETMKNKKRKDTQVYNHLENRLAELNKTITFLMSIDQDFSIKK